MRFGQILLAILPRNPACGFFTQYPSRMLNNASTNDASRLRVGPRPPQAALGLIAAPEMAIAVASDMLPQIFAVLCQPVASEPLYRGENTKLSPPRPR